MALRHWLGGILGLFLFCGCVGRLLKFCTIKLKIQCKLNWWTTPFSSESSIAPSHFKELIIQQEHTNFRSSQKAVAIIASPIASWWYIIVHYYPEEYGIIPNTLFTRSAMVDQAKGDVEQVESYKLCWWFRLWNFPCIHIAAWFVWCFLLSWHQWVWTAGVWYIITFVCSADVGFIIFIILPSQTKKTEIIMCVRIGEKERKSGMLGTNAFKCTTIYDHPWYKSMWWSQCICFISILQYKLFPSSTVIAIINGILTQPQIIRTISPHYFSVFNLSGLSFKAMDKFEMFPLHHKQVNNKDRVKCTSTVQFYRQVSFLPQARHRWHKHV